jgi:hypothetical protein
MSEGSLDLHFRLPVDMLSQILYDKTEDVGKLYELIRRCSYQPDEMVELVMPFGAAGFGE